MADSSARTDQPWQRTRIRVPREDATILSIPPLAEGPGLIDANRRLLDAASIEIAGRPLDSLRHETRSRAVAAAVEFTSSLTGQPHDFGQSEQIVASGHQPELFHPGVWVKNFAVAKLAQKTRSTGINLIVDSDTMASCRIRIPGGSPDRPIFETIEFDLPREVLPWEEARILDEDLLASFADRCEAALNRFPEAGTPLLSSVWPQAVREGRRSGSLSETLSLPRMLLERQLGHGNLELPVSRLCQLEPFSWFAADLLLRADEFREIHNQTLKEFRRVHRIRSRTHPVPELATTNGWTEAPFRIWRENESRRQAVFVRRSGERRLLAGSPSEKDVFLDVDRKADCEEVARELASLADQGFRLRTRALTTTMFTRMCLADLFVHGIGGARYDEMTDRILERFYGLRPPRFLTLSATVWLPFAPVSDDSPADAARLRSMLRELQHNPQKHIPADRKEVARPLVEEKQKLIVAQQKAERQSERNRRSGFDRYRRFPEINRELAALTEVQQARIRSELAEVERRLAASTVLKCREFAACLYPAAPIEKMLTDLDSEF